MAEPVPDLNAVQRVVMRSMLGRVVVLRLLLVPVVGTVMGLVVWLDPDPWRIWLLAGLLVYVAVLFGGEYWRFRWGWSGPHALPGNIVGTLWAQIGVVVVSGGLDSPLLPLLPMAALQVSIAFGRGIPQGAVILAQLVTVWILAGLGLAGHSLALDPLGPLGHGPAWILTVASAMTLMLFVGAFLGTKVRKIVGFAVTGAIASHDSERVAHADHARELVALSAEIAHELKNPLASIKGLSSLLARDLEGKPAERLAVLRAEVERMQETLEEFLNFSRPLVPLTQTDVDLDELVTEVATLCDGVARSRGVTVTAKVGSSQVRADRRKLRQVLVNLVQNAIDAAPPGTAVEIVSRQGALEVLDRGTGLADDVRDIVFDPGVTTRARGSGLGLTIARALVQQHGGSLALVARAGGGTRAVVTLGGDA